MLKRLFSLLACISLSSSFVLANDQTGEETHHRSQVDQQADLFRNKSESERHFKKHFIAFASYYSLQDQFLNSGDAASFENISLEKGISLLNDNKRIRFSKKGVYSISYAAEGQQLSATTGDWSLALFLNNVEVPGTRFSGDITGRLVEIRGQIILHINKGDVLTLRSVSTNQIRLTSALIQQGQYPGVSASLNITQIQ
jgi:hypothetical protein